MMTNTLTAILNEKDVENLYRQYLTKKFGDMVFNSPFGCDGYGESKKHNVRLLCEFKDDLDLTTKVNQVKVLSQAIYYIKKFEISGKLLPSVVLVADRNECFAIHTNEISNYLSMEFDWSIAPSKAHTNIELVNLMMGDNSINPHVFNVKDIDNCILKIKDLTDGVDRYTPITPHNVTEVFRYFEDNVIGAHKLDTNQMANLFVQLLVNPDENYLHPVTRRKTVVTKAFHEVNLKSREVFESFFSHFSREYTPEQREHLTAVVDRLVQDITRRKQGEFFTPAIWVDKAHEYIANTFGEDWKEKYVVWDPAWGTGNLTRDYKFKELYVSTLNYSDIQTAEQMGYNPEAKIKFQGDFLNDPYQYLPQGLKTAIDDSKPILILFNPPYGEAKGDSKEGKIETESTNTEIGKEMSTEKLGYSSRQLYTQFLYRVSKLSKNNNIHIAIFSNGLYKTSVNFTEFRKYFFEKFKFERGFIFPASHFSDVSSGWGIDFSVWSAGNTVEKSFNMEALDYTDKFQFSNLNCVKQYNTDDKLSSSDWIRNKIKGTKLVKTIQLKTALEPKVSNVNNIAPNSLGYLRINTNKVKSNTQEVGLYSTATSNRGGVSLLENNFLDGISLFSARKLVVSNWMNVTDEYLAPQENSEEYSLFKKDSIVYSLFNSHSQQSSLRQVEQKGEMWDVKNQFFWMSKNEMTELANQNNYTELYNDLRTDSDRYVHTLLFGEEDIYNQLSDEAKDVLNSATNLVRLSFGMRRNFADDTNHLDNWDAGYAQLKLLWKEYYPEQFKEFRDKYKVLEDKMRPMVYELGFLLK
jgi:hypothetical protein